MKKNNLLPILLLAGAGVAAFIYFKNKDKGKQLTDGIDIGPIEKEESLSDQTTTSTDIENEPVENKVESYIKTGSSILKKGKQLLRARKKSKTNVSTGPTRKQKRTVKRTARTAKRTARTTRKQRRAVKGFDDLSVLY